MVVSSRNTLQQIVCVCLPTFFFYFLENLKGLQGFKFEQQGRGLVFKADTTKKTKRLFVCFCCCCNTVCLFVRFLFSPAPELQNLLVVDVTTLLFNELINYPFHLIYFVLFKKKVTRFLFNLKKKFF